MYYNALNEELKKRFGCKVYKLALDGGMTCPNRDGTIGSSGCIFCSQLGSGEFAAPVCDSIFQQIETAKLSVAKKVKNAKYIAYFQNFTNTYAPVEYLEKIFSNAIAHPDIVSLSVATRPDCLPDNVIALLEKLNREKPIWVELGLQTIHEKTAAYIRRGYDLNCFDNAVRRLYDAGLEVIVHMIIGLPGESREEIVQTARYIGQSKVEGIKLHLLHVLSGTDLAKEYEDGKFDVLSLNEYISILEDCLRNIPPEVVVHRMTGDGFKRDLIAPKWSGDKKRVLNAINFAFKRDNLEQGEALIR